MDLKVCRASTQHARVHLVYFNTTGAGVFGRVLIKKEKNTQDRQQQKKSESGLTYTAKYSVSEIRENTKWLIF